MFLKVLKALSNPAVIWLDDDFTMVGQHAGARLVVDGICYRPDLIEDCVAGKLSSHLIRDAFMVSESRH